MSSDAPTAPSLPIRKGTSRSRSGCQTCKTRRIRCDELRPRCNQCLKGSRICDYSTRSTKQAPGQLKIVLYDPNRPKTGPRAHPLLSSRENSHAFELFEDKIATALCGNFDSKVWKRMVFQLAQDNTSIRHTLVALAALDDRQRTQPELLNVKSQADTPALKNYGKAITALNTSLRSDKQPITEVVLVSSLLFALVEVYLGDTNAALRHMTGGAHVFAEWQSKRVHQTQAAPDELAQDDTSADEMTVNLETVYRRLSMLLLFPDMSFHDPLVMRPLLRPVLITPEEFHSLEEAKYYLTRGLIEAAHELLAMRWRAGETVRQPRLSLGMRAARRIGPLIQWGRSFERFKREWAGRMTGQEEQAALLLQLEFMHGNIVAHVAASGNSQTAYDAYESHFNAMLELASRVKPTTPTKDVSGHASLVFDMGLMGLLYTITIHCRHPQIRRKALQLIREGPAQQGLWQSDMVQKIAKHVITLEEMACEGPILVSADVPKSARLHISETKIDSSSRTVTLTYCRADEYGQPETVFQQMIIDY